jgi:molybdenum cofactor synthesis domain-containing protein
MSGAATSGAGGPAWRAAVITVSDSRARHSGADPAAPLSDPTAASDSSGDRIAERLAALPAELSSRVVVADEVEAIRAAIRDAAGAADLIVLTGGTGLGPRDVTPQAVAPLLDYEVPGMAEAMRAAGLRSTPRAMLSRQVVGVMGGRLVVALPGSPRAVVEGLAAIWDALPHALALLGGDTVHR